jgi:hypothetical protein
VEPIVPLENSVMSMPLHPAPRCRAESTRYLPRTPTLLTTAIPRALELEQDKVRQDERLDNEVTRVILPITSKSDFYLSRLLSREQISNSLETEVL